MYKKDNTALYFLKNSRYLLLWGVFFFIPKKNVAQDIGPNKQYLLVYDFADKWQVYDEKYEEYVPYIKERHSNYNSFSVILNLEDNRGYKLLLLTQSECFFFLNASLQKKISPHQWVVFDTDSLYRMYHKPQLLVTLYSPVAGVTDKTLLIGNKMGEVFKQNRTIVEEDAIVVRPRIISPFVNFLVLGAVFLLASFAFLYNFQPKAFARYFSIKGLYILNINEIATANKSFDITNLLFLFNQSLLLAFMLVLGQSMGLKLPFFSNFFGDSDKIIALLASYFKIVLLILTGYILKFALILLLSKLYKLEKISSPHFFRAIQISGIFFLILTLVVFVIAFGLPSYGSSTVSFVVVLVAFFFLFRVLLLYITINKLASLKNLYLFSYLCIVELIPIIVGIRFLLPSLGN